MRISDWSSDVCSSDLSGDKARHAPNGHGVDRLFHVGFGRYVLHGDLLYRQREGFGNLAVETSFLKALCEAEGVECCGVRSEEHTSELQSLMRNSYAVFCLKKKKKQTHNINTKTK